LKTLDLKTMTVATPANLPDLPTTR